MSVDKYAICPCGNGKKIKFCKCKESVSELDQVGKMIEGGQIVPALDRLASVLEEHPDAAWALAVRGRLLLDLREYDSLSENAERFIRLQPSNPIALTQKAASSLFHGDVEGATASMLEALTESGRDVDAFVLDVSSVLAYSLAQRGVFLTARVYATLSMMATGYEGGQAAISVLRQLNMAPTINQLVKSIPDTIPRPSDASWAERYDEAATLLANNKVDLAETKFQSLLRTVGNEPAVLSGALTCAIWRGDVDAQSSLLKKLSECESLDMEERANFLATSALVSDGAKEISIPVIQLEAEIQNVEEVEMGMMSSSRFVALPPDLLAGMRESEEDVPPRSGFQILDRDKPESTEQLPPVDEIPEAIALVFLYGKQTDREARVEVRDVRQDNLDEVRTQLSASADGLNWEEQKDNAIPIVVAAQPSVAMVRFQAKPAEAETMQAELAVSRMPQTILNLRLPILGEASLKEAAGDASKLLERTAVMRLLENYDIIASKGDSILDEVRKTADVPALPTIKPESGEIETIPNEDLNRLDLSDLDAESLVYVLHRGQQVSATPAMKRAAERLLQVDLDEEKAPVRIVAYMTLINTAESSAEALELIEAAKDFGTSRNISIANILLSEVSLRVNAGDGEGFQRAVEQVASQYGNEPEVMARLQQMLMSYGLISPDGSPRAAPPPGAAPASPAAAGGGQLWTPDSGTPATPPPAESGGSGGGKLWVPGMD
ncbi:MAG: protein-disulfide isomerase [Planctomycetota bacterium]